MATIWIPDLGEISLLVLRLHWDDWWWSFICNDLTSLNNILHPKSRHCYISNSLDHWQIHGRLCPTFNEEGFRYDEPNPISFLGPAYLYLQSWQICYTCMHTIYTCYMDDMGSLLPIELPKIPPKLWGIYGQMSSGIKSYNRDMNHWILVG